MKIINSNTTYRKGLKYCNIQTVIIMKKKELSIKEKEREEIRNKAQQKGKEEFKKLQNKFAIKFLELINQKKEDNIEYELISAHLGITSQSLTNYLRGDRFPQMEQLILMKDYLGVDFNTLLPSLPTEEKIIRNKKSGDLISLGLSNKAVDNLEKIISYSNSWGFDEQTHSINPILFALNKLLENGEDILYIIGDYLLFPNINDCNIQQKDETNKSNLENEDIYIKLYQYKIMKALEEFINNFRNTKEHRVSVENRKSRVEEIIFKSQKLDDYYNNTDEKLKKEIEQINKQEQ